MNKMYKENFDNRMFQWRFKLIVNFERLFPHLKLERVTYEELSGLLRVKYRQWAGQIIIIVKQYETDDKAIVGALKRAGIVSESTYWKDITFYMPLRDQLLGPPVNSGSDF